MCTPFVAFSFCIASQADDSAEFAWFDPAGVKEPVLLCDDRPSDLVREQFEQFVGAFADRVVSVPKLYRGQAVPFELTHAIIVRGELTEDARQKMIVALADGPNHFGLCIGPEAGLAVYDRRLECLGGGHITILLAAGGGRPLREIELKPRMWNDLTMLRRAAIERSVGNFPPIAPPLPNVPRGTLLIHGGGEMPKEVTDKFIELAGGPEAPIIVLPIAAEGSLPKDESRDTRVWTRAGANNVRSLRARTKVEVESPEFAAAIENAKAVWFSGGRQWRFVDAYMGTKAEELFRGVLARGGVIGGSSAGASIQSQYLPRGSPLGNMDMMAEGYERGLGFLPGVAVDQHFTQRKRHGDMTALMRRYPQILGIGLDEGTAIVVQGSMAQIIGRGGVHFYDYRTGPPAGDADYTLIEAGGRYDLVARRAIAR